MAMKEKRPVMNALKKNIAKRKAKITDNVPEGKFEDTADLKKLCAYFVIVNRGQGNFISKVLLNTGMSCCFFQQGEGTATKQILSLFGLEDNRKDILIGIVRQDYLPDINSALENIFATNKKTIGIGFSVDLTSIMGVQIYSFLANDI